MKTKKIGRILESLLFFLNNEIIEGHRSATYLFNQKVTERLCRVDDDDAVDAMMLIDEEIHNRHKFMRKCTAALRTICYSINDIGVENGNYVDVCFEGRFSKTQIAKFIDAIFITVIDCATPFFNSDEFLS